MIRMPVLALSIIFFLVLTLVTVDTLGGYAQTNIETTADISVNPNIVYGNQLAM